MACLNQTLELQVGEKITVLPAHLDNTARAFFANTSQIIAGRNGGSAAETAVSPTEISITANAPGDTVFTIRMADGGSCKITLRVSNETAVGFQCPVPARVIEHVAQSGALCVSWDDLGLNAETTLARPTLTPPTSFSFSRTEAPCAIRIEKRAMDRFNIGDSIVIRYQGSQNGQTSSCEASIRVVAQDLALPVIDQCVGGKVNLTANTPFQLSVSNARDPVTTLWSSPDPELKFSTPEQTSTMVTANKTGSFTINVECCFDELT